MRVFMFYFYILYIYEMFEKKMLVLNELILRYAQFMLVIREMFLFCHILLGVFWCVTFSVEYLSSLFSVF